MTTAGASRKRVARRFGIVLLVFGIPIAVVAGACLAELLVGVPDGIMMKAESESTSMAFRLSWIAVPTFILFVASSPFVYRPLLLAEGIPAPAADRRVVLVAVSSVVVAAVIGIAWIAVRLAALAGG